MAGGMGNVTRWSIPREAGTLEAAWPRREQRRRVALAATIVILLVAAGTLQERIARRTALLPGSDAMLYLPSGAYLQQMALGYQQVWADILWLRTIGYYADQVNSDSDLPGPRVPGRDSGEKKFAYLYRMLDIITTLDPKFLYPYLFGGVTLSIELRRPDLANAILRKGLREHPDVWKIPFLIGFNTYFGEGDAATAARYIGLAAGLPGAPKYLPGFAARLYTRGGGRDKALAFLSEVIRQTEDPGLRAQLIERYRQIQKGIVNGPAEPPRALKEGT